MQDMDLDTRLAMILGQLKGVRARGGRHVACCPIHGDRTPSLSIEAKDDGTILMHCFATCATKEIMAALGLPMSLLFAKKATGTAPRPEEGRRPTVPEPDDERNVKNAVRLYREACALAGTPGAEYLQGRRIPPALAHANGARYHPRYPYRDKLAPAVVFPLLSGDRDGKVVALNARFIDPQRHTGGEKQRSSGKTSWGVFGTRGSLDSEEVIVTEAPIDALSLTAAGLPALATCGAANLRSFPKLYEGKTIICAFDLDGDPATQDAIRSSMDRLKAAHKGRVVWIKPPGNGLKDWNDLLCRYGRSGLLHYVTRAAAKCKPPVLATRTMAASAVDIPYH